MDIYNVGSRVMNTYIYRTLAGYIMIDTGYEHSLKNVEKRANKQGIALSEIKYVFLTHAHDDHAGFLNELLSIYPNIKVIISNQAMPTLLRGQNSFVGGCSSLIALVFCKIMGILGKGKHLFPAIDKQNIDRFIEISPQNLTNVEDILQGRILFTPGHTMIMDNSLDSKQYPKKNTICEYKNVFKLLKTSGLNSRKNKIKCKFSAAHFLFYRSSSYEIK